MALRVKNFERHQHYKDRSPPWIKLYNDLLSDYEFSVLPDAAKWHAVASWLLASRTNNVLPDDAAWFARMAGATEPVDIDALVSAGFLERYDLASKPLAKRKQVAMPEKRREEERQRREEDDATPAASSDLSEHFTDQAHRNAYHAYRRAHRMPDGMDASLRALASGMNGQPPIAWERIGAALLDMRAGSVDFNPRAVTGFARKVGVPVSSVANDVRPRDYVPAQPISPPFCAECGPGQLATVDGFKRPQRVHLSTCSHFGASQ